MVHQLVSFPQDEFPVIVLVRPTGRWTKVEREEVMGCVKRSVIVDWDRRYPHVLALHRWQTYPRRIKSLLGWIGKQTGFPNLHAARFHYVMQCRLVHRDDVWRGRELLRGSGLYADFDDLAPKLAKLGVIKRIVSPRTPGEKERKSNAHAKASA